MSKTTLGITLRESSKKKDGTSPVMFSISQDGVTRYYPAGVDCKPADWKIINSLVSYMIEDEVYETIRETLKTRGKRFAKLVKTLEYFDFVSFAATWEKNKDSIYLPEEDAPEEAPDTKASERMKVLTKGIPDVFKVYENVMVTKKLGTNYWYNNGYKALKRFLGPEKEYLPFTEVTVEFLKDLDRWMETEGHSDGGPLLDNSINGYLRTLRAIFNVGVAEYSLSKDIYPFAESRREKHKFFIRQGKKRFRILKDDEIEKLFTARFDNPWWEKARKIFLASYMGNGINPIDLFTLRWEDWAGSIITFERCKTKDLVPDPIQIKIEVIPELKDFLMEFASEDKSKRNFILSFLSSKLGYDDLRRKHANFLERVNHYLGEIAEDLGMEKFTMYDARHAFVYKCMINKMEFPVIMELLGHTNPKTTLRYTHSLDDTKMKEYAQKLLEFHTQKELTPNPDDASEMPEAKATKAFTVIKPVPASEEVKKKGKEEKRA